MAAKFLFQPSTLMTVDPAEDPGVSWVGRTVGNSMCPVFRQAMLPGHRSKASSTDGDLHGNVLSVALAVISPQGRQRLVHTAISFGPSCEDVAEIDDLVSWVVLGDGHALLPPKFLEVHVGHVERRT